MTGKEQLVAAVDAAMQRMAQDGIGGWGLYPPKALEDTFTVVEMGSSSGCTSETCAHNSHDPAAPNTKIVPVTGQLMELGWEMGESETGYAYYTLVTEMAARFFCVTDPRFYWASIREIKASDVPEWMLAGVAKTA